MACDKIYGLRKVYIAQETNGVPGTFYELTVSNIEVPKVTAEDIIIDESSGYRMDSAHTSGNLNELTGTITISMPKSRLDMEAMSMNILLKCAGLNWDGTNEKYTVQNNGVCENTFSIYTVDRTGLLAEQLHGCIITSIDATLNRTEVPTLAFAYQAASKVELWGKNGVQGAVFGTLDSVLTKDACNFNDGSNEFDYDLIKPFTVKLINKTTVGDDVEMTVDKFNSDYGLHYSRVGTDDLTGNEYDIRMLPPTDTAASAVQYCSIRGWNMGQDLPYKLQSASFTFTTGLTYGEMVVGERNLSEVLVGTAEVTGTSTVYVDTAVGAARVEQFGGNGLVINVGDWSISVPNPFITDTPDLSLAKNEPASGDLAWKAYFDKQTGEFFSIDVGA